MSISLKLVAGDIRAARMSISPVFNLTNDEIMYNIAAYHTQQAVEKCLKIILNQFYCVDENERRFKTHNIAGLLGMIEEFSAEKEACPLSIPEVIYEMSADITTWEASSRYNDDLVILKKNIKTVLKACQKMVKELGKLGFQ